MPSNLTAREIDDRARVRAFQIAPLPKYSASTAGFVGAMVTGTSASIFMGFARLDSDAFAGAFVATVIIGFVVPLLYVKNLERQHSKAWSQEYEALKSSERNDC